MIAGFGLWFQRNAVASILLFLAACSAVRSPLPPAGTAASNRLAGLSHWRLEGRIAVQTSRDAFQANLFWEHEKRQERVRVSGPFSQGALSIILQDDLIYIRDSGGNVKSSRNVASLLQQELGFAVPLSSLRYWVLGIAEPAARPLRAVYDEAGQLQQLQQQGWRLDFQSFVAVGGYRLPQKLVAQGADLKLKLFVDDWVILR